jgi:hypothetical protein
MSYLQTDKDMWTKILPVMTVDTRNISAKLGKKSQELAPIICISQIKCVCSHMQYHNFTKNLSMKAIDMRKMPAKHGRKSRRGSPPYFFYLYQVHN